MKCLTSYNLTVLDPVQLIYFKPVINEFIKTCAGNHRLNTADRIHKVILSSAVQLGKNIIEHQDRLITDKSCDKFYFREF